MDNEKSLLEKLTETMKDAAHLVTEGAMAIAHPTSGTPMDMPLNELGVRSYPPTFHPDTRRRKGSQEANEKNQKEDGKDIA